MIVFCSNESPSYLITQLAKTPGLNACLPALIDYLRHRLSTLRLGQIPLEALLVSQTLSRPLEEYRVLSPAARAVKQLQAVDKPRFPGQRIRFLFMLGEPGVHAWDLPKSPDPALIDVGHYTDLVLRAGTAVLQPWGIKQEWLRDWVLHWVFHNSLFMRSATNPSLHL